MAPGRAARTGSSPRTLALHDAGTVHEAAIAASRMSSVLGVLRDLDPSHVGSLAPRESALGTDTQVAFGAARAGAPGDAWGFGLGLRGTGRGGGATGGDAIRIGATCVGAHCLGARGGQPGWGYGIAGPPGLNAVHRATAPDGGTPVIRVTPGLDRQIVRRVVRQHMNEIRFCYESQLVRHPEARGRMVAGFVIEATGRVATAAASSSTIGLPPVESCVVDVIRRLEFPRVAGGGTVVVSYPFQFEVAGD
jgi:hypothetical protein